MIVHLSLGRNDKDLIAWKKALPKMTFSWYVREIIRADRKGKILELPLETAEVMDGAKLDAYLPAPVIKYVEYTGTLTINNNYYNVAVEGASKATGSIQYPQDAIKASLTSGSVIKVTGYTIGVSSNKYVNTMAVMVEVIEEGEEPEIPTETKAYTVTEALAAYVDGKQIPAIVTGYIVGAMNSTGYVPEFGTTTVATNLLLSDNADEDNIANCIIVQLPSGNIRSALNLVDNPGN